MPLPRIQKDTPSIKQIWLYTYRIRKNRWEYADRDILPSKIKIVNKLIYKKDKYGKLTTPDERLDIISYSAPQYPPYIKKNSVARQMKIKHRYDVTFSIQKDEKRQYSFDSKLIWRVGSYYKWNKKPPQSEIKTIYKETRQKLIQRYTNKKTNKLDRIKYNNAIDTLKKSAKYLDIGDFNSRELGLNGDFYWRQMPLNNLYDCLYGPKVNREFHTKEIDLNYPFFGKHEISIIVYLIKKKIILF